MSKQAGRTPALRELQEWFAASILAPERPASIAHQATELASWLAVPSGVALADRLAVYVHGYPARVQEALKETFPAVAHIAGAAAFAALADRYVAAVPLRSYNLNDAGDGLAEFLRGDELGEKLPFLPDLALLEWAVARAFHSHELPPLDPSSLATWQWEDWERAVLRFQPSVSIVRSPWPIREIWDARDKPREEIDIDLQNRPDNVFVRRNGMTVSCTSISPIQADILQALLAGATLGDVSVQLVERRQDPSDVTNWFSQWMQEGIVVEVGPAQEG